MKLAAALVNRKARVKEKGGKVDLGHPICITSTQTSQSANGGYFTIFIGIIRYNIMCFFTLYAYRGGAVSR